MARPPDQMRTVLKNADRSTGQKNKGGKAVWLWQSRSNECEQAHPATIFALRVSVIPLNQEAREELELCGYAGGSFDER